MQLETASETRSPATENRAPPISASVSVVELISEVDSTPITELPPLASGVDPDALDRLVANGETTVRFDYAGHTVVVSSPTDLTVH
ncbi:HalOD1 output domain-containing protein [Halomicroarcula sp. GCM10025817]|uniref:HalOD1 output domain-containing protein n=1 Tax=Haloarcula TaxID=2237 RepID=UPI0023E82A7D|nr:HalOD1 output domain-containing protein [Halomicroarcula sp. SYNS111]